MLEPWWKRKPHWLDQELKALEDAGIRYRRDEHSFKRGVARLHLEVDVDGETVRLTVTFPDLYPYFRFEVQAPELSLDHHQNPFEKNLCLLRKGTEHWSPRDTVAGVLQEQLRDVLKTGRSQALEEVQGLEAPQAEPISTYYPSVPGVVIVNSGWDIDPKYRTGRFVVGTQMPPGQPPTALVRGAVLDVMDGAKNVLATADESVKRAFAGATFQGRWARVVEPVLATDPLEFLQRLFELVPWLADAPANQFAGGWFKLWAVLFPEEVRHRQTGEGWTFIARADAKYGRLNQSLDKLRKQR